jgi:hypothetical protein
VSIRDRIIAANDTAKEIVDIPEWGVKVEVRSMSGAARAVLVQDAANNDGKLNFTRMLPEILIGCMFDPETGERIFDGEDTELLMDKSGAVLDKIIAVAMRLSGFNEGAVDTAGKGS